MIKRYEFNYDESGIAYETFQEDGDWVRYEDVKHLIEKRKRKYTCACDSWETMCEGCWNDYKEWKKEEGYK